MSNSLLKRNKSIKVALTGGIGSGKTYVSTIFQKLGIPVFYADIVSKQLINTSPDIKLALTTLFGNEIYLRNGTIHRKKLANIIFNDNIALQKINSIIHPKIRDEFEYWIKQHSTAPYVIEEAAIIFESGQSAYFDKIITVTAPLKLKLERVMERDKISYEKVLERMNNQYPDKIKIEQSDYIIENDNRKMILPQILSIHEKLLIQWQSLENG